VRSYALGVALECRGVVVSATARKHVSGFDGTGEARGSTSGGDVAIFGSLGTRF
jgi:hypothetical protein